MGLFEDPMQYDEVGCVDTKSLGRVWLLYSIHKKHVFMILNHEFIRWIDPRFLLWVSPLGEAAVKCMLIRPTQVPAPRAMFLSSICGLRGRRMEKLKRKKTRP